MKSTCIILVPLLLLLSCGNDDDFPHKLTSEIEVKSQSQDTIELNIKLSHQGDIYYALLLDSEPTPSMTTILNRDESSFLDWGKIKISNPANSQTIMLSGLVKYQDHAFYYVLNQPDETSSDEVHDISLLNRLTQIGDAASNTENLYSILVSVDDKIIMERYYSEGGVEVINDVRSVTKSFTSILVGIALDKGYINSLDETIADYLPGHYLDGLSDTKKGITIRNLLTMSSGLFWDESKYIEWIRAPDEVEEMLQRDLVTQPGETWHYNTGAMHLLSAIITEASGMSSAEFANKYLLEFLGSTEGAWEVFETGYNNGGAGLSLYPRTFVKMGQMMLNDGVYNEQQILSKEYIEESTSPHFNVGYRVGEFSNNFYGYQWWLDRANSSDAFTGWGYGGQFLYCIPSKNTVIFSSSNRRVNFPVAIQQEENTIDIIINQIIPALE